MDPRPSCSFEKAGICSSCSTTLPGGTRKLLRSRTVGQLTTTVLFLAALSSWQLNILITKRMDGTVDGIVIVCYMYSNNLERQCSRLCPPSQGLVHLEYEATCREQPSSLTDHPRRPLYYLLFDHLPSSSLLSVYFLISFCSLDMTATAHVPRLSDRANATQKGRQSRWKQHKLDGQDVMKHITQRGGQSIKLPTR